MTPIPVPLVLTLGLLLGGSLLPEVAAGPLRPHPADDDVTSGVAPSRLIQGKSLTITKEKELQFTREEMRQALLSLLFTSWRKLYTAMRKHALERPEKPGKKVKTLEEDEKTQEEMGIVSAGAGRDSTRRVVSRRSAGPAYQSTGGIPPEVVSLVLQGWQQHLDRQSEAGEDPLTPHQLMANGRGRGDISIGLDVNALKLAMADMDRLDYQGKMRMAQAKLINIGKRN